MSAIDEIKSLVGKPDPYRDAPSYLRDLQLEAVRERFFEKRSQLKIVDRRASDAGIEEIHTLDDLVSLLFVHTNYKSYPESFVDKGQWANMSLWLQTLTSAPVTKVKMDGVKDADEWLNRLRGAGHELFASSGTSGKCSFLDQTPADVTLALKAYEQGFLAQWAPLKPQRDRTSFVFFPPTGVHRLCGPNHHFWTNFVSPAGEAHFVSDEPLLAAPGIRAGQLRRALAAGTAMPDEIAAFEAENATRAQKMDAAVADFMDQIYENRHNPLAFGVMWPQAFQVVQTMRARGVKDGDMHPDTVLCMGGGVKGVKLPDDYKEQIYSFFGLKSDRYFNSYAMVEMTGLSPLRHDLNAYAIPPWIVPLVLDKTGEKLLNPEDGKGQVEGRMALFDLLTDARWGGLISGDKVVVDFDSADGFSGPLVRSIARYQDLEEGEDKLTCAGTIDSYVRGAINL
ncbi:MAG: hypothetical protein JWM78_444 [Verrucomicrobiaceae bacterium]|nr:hypothetical protein [Verrucomicrobiaceae bacterium]